MTVPKYTGDLPAWAAEVERFLIGETRVQQSNDPRPVLLSHRLPAQPLTANPDGILMYDSVLAKPIVSISGAWETIALDAAVYYNATYQDFTPTDTFAPVPIDTSPGGDVEPGTYMFNLYGVVTGTGGNAFYQFRFISAGGDVTGSETPVGNGEIRALATGFTVSTGSGNTMTLEMRGSAVTFTGGYAVMTRIGAA